MSWESSVEYYRIINETVKAKLGGFHSARSLMYSVDFAEIEALQHEGKWTKTARVLIEAAQFLERGGAEFVVLCTNTMHKVAEDIQAQIHIPFLHIVDATAQNIREKGVHKVGLLGTSFTMEEDFYTGRLIEKYGLEVVIPDNDSRAVVHGIIYDELVKGEIRAESRNRYIEIIEELVRKGAEGIILGCTEIGLLVRSKDCRVPLFDTTRIHAVAAAEYALGE